MPESPDAPITPSSKGRVLAFGTYNVRKHPRVRILMEGLRRNGWQVDEANDPLTLSTSERVEILKKPWKILGFGIKILRLWHSISAQAKDYVHSYGEPNAVLVGYMGHFDMLLARHLFKRTPIVLDHLIFAADTAKDRGAAGLKVRLLKRLDAMALKRANLIVVDTAEHQEMLEGRRHSLVIPVGAPQEWYDAGRDASASERKGIIFYGLYTPLQGATVIAQALVLLAQRGITTPVDLIGTGQDYEAVRKIVEPLNNVTLHDWVEPEDLPALVSHHQISLGIFSTTPKGLHVVPNKVYQSMAAGCAVVTSDSAPQRRMLAGAAVLTQPGSPGSLANTLERLLTDPQALTQAQNNSRGGAQRFRAETITVALSTWLENICSATRGH